MLRDGLMAPVAAPDLPHRACRLPAPSEPAVDQVMCLRVSTETSTFPDHRDFTPAARALPGVLAAAAIGGRLRRFLVGAIQGDGTAFRLRVEGEIVRHRTPPRIPR